MRYGIGVPLLAVLYSFPVFAADEKLAPPATIDLSVNETEIAERDKGARVEIVALNRVPTVIYRRADTEEIPPTMKDAPPEPANPCTDVDALLRSALKTADDEIKVKTAVETAQAKIASCTADIKQKFRDTAAALTTIHLGPFTVESGADHTVQLSRGDKRWSVLLRAKKTAEEVAAAKQDALSRARIASLSPDRNVTVKKCSWGAGCTDDPIYINADHVAIVYIDNIPRSPMTVRVTAGEHSDCEALDFNEHQFTQAHDQIAIPLHMRNPGFEWLPGVPGRRETYGLELYGLLEPIDVTVTNRADHSTTRRLRSVRSPDRETRDILCTRTASLPHRPASYVNIAGVDVPSVPLLLRGKSELVTVEIDDNNGQHQTFDVHIAYQRFWLDAGGFFAFSRETNDELIKDPPSTANGKATVKVTQIRTVRDLNPATGIVLNIHPGNLPYVAAQFGIATQQERQPSYYFGAGLRLREIGKRSLATIAAGLAAVQSSTFPGLTSARDSNGDIVVPADSPLLIPHTQYHFEPYFSISLGFSFGGVSEGTDVTRRVGAQQ